jgi:flagellar hook protein FlgE
MSLTTALFTALTGMDVHSKSLDVIGNNIANVNTVGFKGSRALFENQLSRSLGYGTAPTAESGGTNPSQVGLGVLFSGTQRNFTNGAIQPTGINTDLALEGPGMFILRRGTSYVYTRAGQFDLDTQNNLVSTNGGIAQGFGVDANFNLVPGVKQDINIPLGTLTVAEATRNVDFAGNLNPSGTTASLGTIIASQDMDDLSTGVAATTASLLTDLTSDGVTPLFASGAVITLQGVEKGGKSLGTFTFEVGATNTTNSDGFGTTLDDMRDWLEDVLGLNTSVDGAGVSITAGGAIQVTGNYGLKNDVTLATADFVSNAAPTQPLVFTKSQEANGESVRTTLLAYDSLGTPLTVDVTMVLASKAATGTTWRFYAESVDDTDVSLSLGTGTLEFNTFGELQNVSNPNITIDRTDTGAVDPLTITLNFDNGSQRVTALTDAASTLAAVRQDGSAIGRLQEFSIGENGVITGAFSNGLTRTLGQIALSTFANPEGLVDAGGNAYIAGANSGLPVDVAPLTFGTGRIISGALELSNIDLSQEFVNLITTSTGFSASSRVITTGDQLIQQLLALAR